MQDARLYAFPSSLAGYFSPWMGQQFNLIDDITHLGGRGAQNFFFFRSCFLISKMMAANPQFTDLPSRCSVLVETL